MTKSEFVKRFGSIFEHSPWVAERVYDAQNVEDTNAQDWRAEGLHNDMCTVFDKASQEERLGVLRAHPDLAGKLAQAKRLTAASTAEQASAGLDMLTDEERAMFTALNTDYVAKFAFPFIICVRDYDKAGILEAFQKRLKGTRDAEFQIACAEVKRIAWHRLQAATESPSA